MTELHRHEHYYHTRRHAEDLYERLAEKTLELGALRTEHTNRQGALDQQKEDLVACQAELENLGERNRKLKAKHDKYVADTELIM